MANVWIITDHDVDVKSAVEANGKLVYLEDFFKFQGSTEPAPTVEVRRAK